MENTDTKGRDNGQGQTVHAEGELLAEAITPKELDELMQRLSKVDGALEELTRFKKQLEDASEKARFAALSPAERIAEEADELGDKLQSAGPERAGLYAKLYVDARLRAEASAKAQAEQKLAHQEYLESLPAEQRAVEELKARFGPKNTEALLEVLATKKAADRRRLLKKVAALALAGTAYASLAAWVVQASRPKTLKAKIATRIINWAFDR